jgi:hypothetical protein
MSFIEANKKNPLYSNSLALLMKMYTEMYPSKRLPEEYNLKSSPDWRCLEAYGGWMKIEKFRESLDTWTHEKNNKIIYNMPKIHPVGYVFTEKYIF